MLITVVVALRHGPKIIVLMLLFLQWSALVWYIASYIPFGQRVLKRLAEKVSRM